tara:strand:+ start:642 stop:869 length:228 start_codon:yes stop_codon:yes gene_type:complete
MLNAHWTLGVLGSTPPQWRWKENETINMWIFFYTVAEVEKGIPDSMAMGRKGRVRVKSLTCRRPSQAKSGMDIPI